MKSIAPNLRTYIAETLGKTCYLGVPPRGTDPPFVLLKRSSLDTAGSLDDTPDVGGETLLVQCMSKGDDSEAWDTEVVIREALEDYSGAPVVGGRTIKAVHVMDERDIDQERLPEDDAWWFGAELELLIQHQA